MHTHEKPILPLFAVVILATLLTFVVSYGASARTVFQSPPPPSGTVTPTPGTIVPTLEQPTVVPAPVGGQPSPTAAGFLPAPTIVNPNDIESLPLARPAVVIPGSEPDPTPTLQPPGGRSELLEMVEVAFDSLGLVCGVLLLVGAVAAAVFLVRQGRWR